MNPAPEPTPASDTESSGNPANPAFRPPTHWREAILTLIATRVALVQHESREAATHAARKAIFIAAMAACVFFAWAFILVGGIACISSVTGVGWPAFALLVGFLHLLAALIFLGQARKSAPPAFPVTRSEFQKDREWIENFQKTPRS